MANQSHPGVYIEEISTFPPSVAEVSTAIPAFIGYTQTGAGTTARINTLLEYEGLFGMARNRSFSVKTRIDPDTERVVVDKIVPGKQEHEFYMHYCLSHYFQNGGGACYIISIGDYTASPAFEHFKTGLDTLEQEDEPTLILFPDAVNLKPESYYSVCDLALAQCKKLGDRFTILDVKDEKSNVPAGVDKLRSHSIGADRLMYGAAYCPYLETILTYQYEKEEVSVPGTPPTSAGTGETSSAEASLRWRSEFGGIVVTRDGKAGDDTPKVQITKGEGAPPFEVDAETPKLTISNVGTSSGDEVVEAWRAWAEQPANEAAGFEIVVAAAGGEITTTGQSSSDLKIVPRTLKSIESTETALYNQIKQALAEQRVILPPSAAVAGIYARVDRDRGVWKAPANVSISSIIGPVSKITNDLQDTLNIDSESGKSINAIRSFSGKGTLVWGARTLAGNDNEWRYVSVRRLFNMIEESAKKSTSFAVFEPNDATTWLKVKGMLESYLYGLWERGALQGSTPEAAYFVNVGLGKTMRPQDVLEGRMIVELGIAAVRPAEFIFLRFTHKLAEG